MLILGSQAPVDSTKYLYTLPRCTLRYHYKAYQWLNLVCSEPAEVSPEVSVQTIKAPLLRCVVLRRVHSTRSTDWYAKLALPHTMAGRTHVGSWLHYFLGWSLREPVLIFGYDD
jgi:hypothetical protein